MAVVNNYSIVLRAHEKGAAITLRPLFRRFYVLTKRSEAVFDTSTNNSWMHIIMNTHAATSNGVVT